MTHTWTSSPTCTTNQPPKPHFSSKLPKISQNHPRYDPNLIKKFKIKTHLIRSAITKPSNQHKYKRIHRYVKTRAYYRQSRIEIIEGLTLWWRQGRYQQIAAWYEFWVYFFKYLNSDSVFFLIFLSVVKKTEKLKRTHRSWIKRIQFRFSGNENETIQRREVERRFLPYGEGVLFCFLIFISF